MKAIVLAGGHGTRLRPLTHSGPKQTIPIANKPVIHSIIEDIAACGVNDIGIIVGYTPERINAIKECINSREWDVRITYIEQDAPRGLAHAAWIAKEFIDGDEFVMYLGDNILKGGIKHLVDKFEDSDAAASLLLTKSETPEKFGVATIQGSRIIKLEEKPKNPESNYIITGIYLFRPVVFDFIRDLKPSARGELEITHAMQNMLESGKKITFELVREWWDDAGTAEAVLHANHMLLQDITREINGTVDKSSKIIGNVSIGTDSKIEEDVVIRGPVIIGRDCRIKKSYIGPYTSIGNKCIILNSDIESSIIMEECDIETEGKKIIDSLVGKRTKIKPSNSLPKGSKFVIGEDSEISL